MKSGQKYLDQICTEELWNWKNFGKNGYRQKFTFKKSKYKICYINKKEEQHYLESWQNKTIPRYESPEKRYWQNKIKSRYKSPDKKVLTNQKNVWMKSLDKKILTNQVLEN